MKTAEEIQNEVRSYWIKPLSIFSDSLDACFDLIIKDDEILQELKANSQSIEKNKVEFMFNREILTLCVEEHCFKKTFWGLKQVRFHDVKLKPMLTEWPFPDNIHNNFVEYILQKSVQYQAFKNRYKDSGYVVEEAIFPHAVRGSIGMSETKLF